MHGVSRWCCGMVVGATTWDGSDGRRERVLAAMGLRWADSWRAGARTLPMNAGCAASIGVPIGPSVIEL